MSTPPKLLGTYSTPAFSYGDVALGAVVQGRKRAPHTARGGRAERCTGRGGPPAKGNTGKRLRRLTLRPCASASQTDERAAPGRVGFTAASWHVRPDRRTGEPDGGADSYL